MKLLKGTQASNIDGGRRGRRCRQLFLQQGRGRARRCRDHRQGGARLSPFRPTFRKARRTSRRLVCRDEKAFGTVDILVNNAGVYEFAPLEEVTPEHFHKKFDLNVLGLILATQEAVKHSAPRGQHHQHQLRGRHRGAADHLGLQRDQGRRRCDDPSLAKELGPAKFASTRSIPAWSKPKASTAAGIAEAISANRSSAQTPLGRIGQPQDIAPAAVFLASDDSAWITGETLYISGGMRPFAGEVDSVVLTLCLRTRRHAERDDYTNDVRNRRGRNRPSFTVYSECRNVNSERRRSGSHLS